jgi:hypothetical protein
MNKTNNRNKHLEQKQAKQRRDKRSWQLMDNANRLAPYGSSLQKCGLVPRSINVTAIIDKYGISYAGLKQCKSAWSCPRCSPANSARKGEIFAEIHEEITKKTGYKPVMITYTIQHKNDEPLQELLDIIRSCYRYIFKGSRGKRFLKISYGYISAFEITHGFNGWHPHFHVLFYLKNEITDDQINEWLIDPYTKKLAGTGKLVRSITVHRQEWNGKSDYLTKGSAVSELTGSMNKKSRNIMDILANAKEGNRWHKLYLEFIDATKRVKAINTSGRITERFKIKKAEIEKAKKIQMDSAEIVKTFTRDEWQSIIRTGTRYEVLAEISKSVTAEHDQKRILHMKS